MKTPKYNVEIFFSSKKKNLHVADKEEITKTNIFDAFEDSLNKDTKRDDD